MKAVLCLHGYEGGPLPVTVSSNSPSSQDLTLTAISGFTIRAERPETITPNAGGFMTNTDIGANFQMEIPANALGTGSNAATVTSKINTAMPNPPSGAILKKNAVSINAVGSDGSPISSLNDEITVTIPYTEADLPAGTTEASLVIGVWNDANQTYDTLSTTVDTTLNTLTATVSHLSDFAPLVASGGSAPSTPTNLTVSNHGNGTSVILTWSTDSGVASYNIYRSTDNSSFPLLANTGTVTGTYTATGLSNGTTYYFKISSQNSTGDESAATGASSLAPFVFSAGGGGGGGGGVTTVVATTIPAVPAVPATPAVPGITSAVPATPATPATSAAPAAYNFGASTLKSGSRGEAVKELQRFLNNKLNLGLTVDGALGPKTIIVIKQWQQDNGLVPDGLIGPKTKALMNTTTQ